MATHHLTFLHAILAQTLPLRWHAPWLLPAVLGLTAAVAAAVLWYYPAQVRRVRRPWRYVLPGLRLLALGALAFTVAKPVSRCVMTTLDTVSLTTAKEPVRTLARHRLVEGKTTFALHLLPLDEGRVSVGDEVVAT